MQVQFHTRALDAHTHCCAQGPSSEEEGTGGECMGLWEDLWWVGPQGLPGKWRWGGGEQ